MERQSDIIEIATQNAENKTAIMEKTIEKRIIKKNMENATVFFEKIAGNFVITVDILYNFRRIYYYSRFSAITAGDSVMTASIPL